MACKEHERSAKGTPISNDRVASHAGVFRGARLWGGKKYELP